MAQRGYLGSIDSFKQSKPYVAVVKDGAGIGRAMLLPSNSSIIGTMQNIYYLKIIYYRIYII